MAARPFDCSATGVAASACVEMGTAQSDRCRNVRAFTRAGDSCRRANLKIIIHNSVAKYRGAHNTQEIGRALNVAHILMGSVRRDAGRIHLNVQLIDTRDDSRLWSEEYDRDLNDVFALQTQIAQKVADRLGAKVSSSERAAIDAPPTTDLVAYDAYLRAKDLINDLSLSTRQKEDLSEAVQLLDQAVARDRLFFDAYAQLAGAH